LDYKPFLGLNPASGKVYKLNCVSPINIQLAYYPPYHSKYNPIERVWGVLENYWIGQAKGFIFHFAQNMTYNGLHPVVQIVEKTYHTGIKLTKKVMDELENVLNVCLV